MQFTQITLVSVIATAVSANPIQNTNSLYMPCPPGLYSTPQCCATDVLGVADLDCHSSSSVPISPSDFRAICAVGGDRARCCVFPILGQPVLCGTPVGFGEQ